MSSVGRALTGVERRQVHLNQSYHSNHKKTPAVAAARRYVGDHDSFDSSVSDASIPEGQGLAVTLRTSTASIVMDFYDM